MMGEKYLHPNEVEQLVSDAFIRGIEAAEKNAKEARLAVKDVLRTLWAATYSQPDHKLRISRIAYHVMAHGHGNLLKTYEDMQTGETVIVALDEKQKI